MTKKLLTLTVFTLLLAGCGGGNDGGTYATEPRLDDTLVSVVEFSDFSCPACRGAHEETRKIRQIKGVQFEYRHFPLDIPGHEQSRAAANAYECAAAQGYAAEAETALFANQGNFSEELFLALPTENAWDSDAGFDLAAYQTCVSDTKYASTVADDYRAAMSAGLSGTPSFVVNGRIMTGTAQLRDAIDEAILKAQSAEGSVVQ
jgi:protein-disulfide isomerase